jgi:hypothetical protein
MGTYMEKLWKDTFWIQVQIKLDVVTLALGLQPRQGLARLWAKKEAWESHLMFLEV